MIPRRRTPELGFKLRASGIETFLRSAAFVVAATLRHSRGWLADRFVAPAQRDARRGARTLETVQRAVALLGRLKGAFVKAGQFASVRHDLVPRGAAEALADLQSRVPPMPLRSICHLMSRGTPMR